jgi:hypothetical protein
VKKENKEKGMKNKEVGSRIFFWLAIICMIFSVSYYIIQTIIREDERNRDRVVNYCSDYVFEDFKQEYGDFDLIVGSAKISYIQELNSENIKSAGYKVEVKYQVDDVWYAVNYHIDIWWKERNFLDRRTDKIRENQIIDYEIVSLQ